MRLLAPLIEFIASNAGYEKIVEILLKSNAQLNVKDENGLSPLMLSKRKFIFLIIMCHFFMLLPLSVT